MRDNLTIKHSDFNLVPIFVAVMEELSLSGAAKRLDMSQPAVSQAINRMRELYQDPLFSRSQRGVLPTRLALDLFPALQQAVQAYQATMLATKRFRPEECDRVFSLRLNSTLNFTLAPALIRRIYKTAPKCAVEVHPLITADLEADLRFQRFDLIIGQYKPEFRYMQHDVVLQDELVVVARADHPRIADTLTEEEFLAEKHVVQGQWLPRSSNTDDLGVNILKRRKLAWSASGVMEKLYVVANSDWIALMQKKFADVHCSEFNLKRLEPPFPSKVTGAMMWLPSNTTDPAHKWFREQCRLAAEEVGYQPK